LKANWWYTLRKQTVLAAIGINIGLTLLALFWMRQLAGFIPVYLVNIGLLTFGWWVLEKEGRLR